MDLSHTSRRDFLKASGALVVSVMVPGTVPIARAQTSGVGDGKPPLLPDELDSWIAILPDGNVTAFFGKMDMGQGVDVAIGDRKSTRLNSSHANISYAVFCLKKKRNWRATRPRPGLASASVALRERCAF